MAKGVAHDWAPVDDLLDLVREVGTIVGAARRLGITDKTLRSKLEREGVLDEATCIVRRGGKAVKDRGEKPSTKVNGDIAVIVTPPAPDLGDLEALIRERGLDPDCWDILDAVLNEWDSNAGDGQIVKLRQLKVRLRRRMPLDWIFPAVDVQPRIVKPAKPSAGSRTVVLLGDQHAPYHDRNLHAAVLALVAHLHPDEVVCLGDLGDYASISRFRDNPAWCAGPQECIQTSFEILSDYRAATDGAIVLLKGNHDWRLETELLARAERMYGIKPAEVPGAESVPAFSLRHLLHLDELGVRFVEPDLEGDDYSHAEYWLTDRLVAIHGKHVRNGAEKHAESMGASVVQGHTHKLRHSWIVRHSGPAAVKQHLDAVECGTLRQLGVSVGYDNRPKSQQGCAVATLHPDGTHAIELVPWDGAGLLLRGERFTA